MKDLDYIRLEDNPLYADSHILHILVPKEKMSFYGDALWHVAKCLVALFERWGIRTHSILEMVNNEDKGCLFATPICPGDTVYWLLDDDGWYVSDGDTVADVGTKGFYTNGVAGLGDIEACPDFIPWSELGKNVFMSREEAEAALAKMKED